MTVKEMQAVLGAIRPNSVEILQLVISLTGLAKTLREWIFGTSRSFLLVHVTQSSA